MLLKCKCLQQSSKRYQDVAQFISTISGGGGRERVVRLASSLRSQTLWDRHMIVKGKDSLWFVDRTALSFGALGQFQKPSFLACTEEEVLFYVLTTQDMPRRHMYSIIYLLCVSLIGNTVHSLSTRIRCWSGSCSQKTLQTQSNSCASGEYR